MHGKFLVGGGGRRRRGSTLVATVLLSAIAASIVLVLARQTVLSLRAESNRYDASAAAAAARSAQELFEAELAADPAFFLTAVWDYERARVCVAAPATVHEPGTAWDQACGPVWDYQAPATDQTLPGTDAVVRAEISGPRSGDPHLELRVLARVGRDESGLVARYRLDGPGQFAVLSEDDLRLDDLGPSSTVTGGVYSAAQLYLPDGSGVTVSDAQLAAEGGFVPAPTDETLRYYARLAAAGEPPVRDIRSILPEPLSVGELRTGARSAAGYACPTTVAETPVAPQEVALDRDGDGTDEATVATWLCLRPGAEVLLEDGSTATVPTGVAAWQLLVGASGDPDTVTVRYATTPFDPVGECAVTCALTDLAAPEVAAGTHPGTTAGFPDLLGDLRLPASGLIHATADVHLGSCGPAFLTAGADCDTVSGTDPGMEVASDLTVVAGTPAHPADIWVAGSLHAPDARVGLVATGSIVVPYWSRPPGQDLDVDAALLALGAATPGHLPIRTFPTALSTDPIADGQRGGELRLFGSVAAERLDLSFSLFDSVRLEASPAVVAAGPPWFPAFGARWTLVAGNAASSAEVCGLRTCHDF